MSRTESTSAAGSGSSAEASTLPLAVLGMHDSYTRTLVREALKGLCETAEVPLPEPAKPEEKSASNADDDASAEKSDNETGEGDAADAADEGDENDDDRAKLDAFFRGGRIGRRASDEDGGGAASAAASDDNPLAVDFKCDWERVAVQWDEFERIDWSRVLSGRFMANSYCVRKGLIRKAQLAFNLRKYAAKNKRSILNTGVPETHLFEIDHPDYIDEALNDLHE